MQAPKITWEISLACVYAATDSKAVQTLLGLKLIPCPQLEKATNYDERRRLRAQIRELRRLGPAAATSTPVRKTSPTRQVSTTNRH